MRLPSRASRRPALRLEALEDRTVLSFAAPAAFNLPGTPQAVATGHFEGNNAPLDTVTANADGTVSVFLGQSGGALQNPINITVGGDPTSVAVGDLLGNGLQDIVTGNSNGTVNVVLSNGKGTFGTPTSISIGATPVALAVADFNGDGKLDVVTANSNGTVTFLPGNGKGSFGSPTTTNIGGTFTSVAVGDFNGDKKPDLVVGTSTGLDVLLGNGNGTFALNQTVPFAIHYANLQIPEPVTAVAVSDLRGNGIDDVVALAGSEVNVLLGNGNGTVQGPVAYQAGGFAVRSFAVGDFAGNGKPDVVTSNDSAYNTPATLSVLANNGNGTFKLTQTVTVGETATALATGDFRGTGKLDLVLAAGPGTDILNVLPGNGNGTFAVAPSYAAGTLPEHMAAGVFTSSGKPDLVVTDLGGGATVLLNNGDGTFRPGPNLSLSSIADAVVVGDFTGNGKQDIAVGNQDGTIDVFLGNGNGTFQAPKVFNLGSSDVVRSLVTGHFTTSGHLDLAATVDVQNQAQTGEVVVLLGNGNGTFRRGQTINVGTDALGLASADFNNDGKADLVTTTMLADGTRDVKALLGNGNGTFKAPLSTPTGFAPTSVATGDFNGDGKPDLVLIDYFDTDNSVLVMTGNGNGTFGKPLAIKFNAQLGFEAPVVGDFFGDGKLSVAVTTGDGSVSVLRGNGDGTFQAPSSTLTDFNGSFPNALVVADFNGDGKPDLAVSNFVAGDVSVLLNTSPPPSHANPAATATALTADTTTAVFGQTVTLTASVTSSGGTPSGTVTFFDGSTILGEVAVDPNGRASLLVTLTSTGPHSLRASFAGIAPFTASASAVVNETVNKDATTTTASAYLFGSNVAILSATVTPNAPGSGVPTGTITFFDGTKVVGTAQLFDGSASLMVYSLTKGQHTITASYSGDRDFLASVSVPFILTVP
jgi:hypothetical protein